MSQHTNESTNRKPTSHPAWDSDSESISLTEIIASITAKRVAAATAEQGGHHHEYYVREWPRGDYLVLRRRGGAFCWYRERSKREVRQHLEEIVELGGSIEVQPFAGAWPSRYRDPPGGIDDD